MKEAFNHEKDNLDAAIREVGLRLDAAGHARRP